MKQRSVPRLTQPAYAYVLPALISAALVWGAATPAFAQEEAPTPVTPAVVAPQEQDETVGTLTVRVIDVETGKPVKDALITVDGPKVASRVQARTDYSGIAVIKVPEGTYDVYFGSTRYRIDPKPKNTDNPIAQAEVKARQNVNLDLKVAQVVDDLLVINALSILDSNEFGNVTRRDARMIQEIPLTGANPQSLSNVLRSVPGLVPDAVNQNHGRGENSAASATYVDGILMPQMLAGRANAFWNPQNFRNLTVRTGGFAPEYGGGSGAIYDIRLRDADFQRPSLEYGLRLGTYGTKEVTFNFGTTVALLKGRRGQPRVDTGRRFRYLIGFDSRYTDNGLEPPQSGNQTAFNQQASELFFAKVGFDLKPGQSIDVLINQSSGRTNIAQRTGLSSNPVFGQGFRFTGIAPGGLGFTSQRDENQRLRQKDNNSLLAVKYSMITKNGTQAQVSLGAAKSTQTYVNVGTFNRRFVDLPGNISTEFVPAAGDDTDVIFLQGDVTPPPVAKAHALKYGASLQFFNGSDAYQYFPQSQEALTQLGRLDPRLIPATPGNFVAPVVFADRSGIYGTGYIQDTFKVRTRRNTDLYTLAFNIGVRFDYYTQDIKTRDNQLGGANNYSLKSANQTEISPRLNIIFDLTNPANKFLKSPTLVRVGYNRMFAQPGFGQGNFIGFQPGSNGTIPVNAARPQTVDEYDLSIERQLNRDKIVRISMYSKDITRILVARQLIEGMQYGFLAMQSLSGGVAEGYEITFDLKPPKGKNGKQGIGPYGYASLSISETRPTGSRTTDNLGRPFGQTFYDHDQAMMFNLGAAYRLKDGATAGLTFYYGSGLFASALSFPGSALTSGGREAVTQMDLRYNTGPRFWNNRISLVVDIENLTGSTARLNYRNGIAGTRFQQGRRLMLSAVGRY